MKKPLEELRAEVLEKLKVINVTALIRETGLRVNKGTIVSIQKGKPAHASTIEALAHALNIGLEVGE